MPGADQELERGRESGHPLFVAVGSSTIRSQHPGGTPSSDSYEVGPFEPSELGRTVSRIEFDFQADFGAWLAARGDTVRRLRMPVGNTVMEPDLYNETSGEIIEAKKSSARGYVRNAIGQVLDYVHTAQKVMDGVRPSILLPGIPTPDLVELCAGLGITVWVRDGDGFRSVSPTSAPALER